MALDPEGLVTFEGGGKTYTAFFGFRAMKTIEQHYDLPFFQALQRAMPSLSAEDAGDAAKVAAAGASIRLSDVGKLFEVSLLKHHPDVTEEEVEELIDAIGFEKAGAILGQAVAAALTKEGDVSSSENPPGPRLVKKTG
jgi:hypothetical protein